jgi:non-canonical (house-cleaning) NTP pyrophosphatase
MELLVFSLENVLDRVQLYEQAVILALIPFKNEALYTRNWAI